MEVYGSLFIIMKEQGLVILPTYKDSDAVS